MPIRASILAALACAGTAASQHAADERALLDDLPTVGAASLHARTLAEASANVTVIGAAEICGYLYRTPAEAPASFAGARNTSDKRYEDPIHPDVDRIAGERWTVLRPACRVGE